MASFEDYLNFFTAVNKQIISDEDDGELQIKSIYKPVIQKVNVKILQSTIIFLPHCELAILQVFSAEPLLANVSLYKKKIVLVNKMKFFFRIIINFGLLIKFTYK